MNFDEIEFKYNASKISLEDFHNLCKELKPLEKINQGGSDTFYISKIDDTQFCRHRIGRDINQLTYKKKTCLENSIVRQEINVDLAPNTTAEIVAVFLHSNGYETGKTIGKMSFIYIYQDYIIAYYICYDDNMEELGRFLEIEVREDRELGDIKSKLSWLNILERQVKSLGLTAKDRMSESLFEMFGKE